MARKTDPDVDAAYALAGQEHPNGVTCPKADCARDNPQAVTPDNWYVRRYRASGRVAVRLDECRHCVTRRAVRNKRKRAGKRAGKPKVGNGNGKNRISPSDAEAQIQLAEKLIAAGLDLDRVAGILNEMIEGPTAASPKVAALRLAVQCHELIQNRDREAERREAEMQAARKEIPTFAELLEAHKANSLKLKDVVPLDPDSDASPKDDA